VARGITKEWFDKIKASVNEKSRGGSKKKYLAEIVGTFILVYLLLQQLLYILTVDS
jgi:hypothetical protein